MLTFKIANPGDIGIISCLVGDLGSLNALIWRLWLNG